MKDAIIIISHERSGTHLTLDSIRNNFSDYKHPEYITLDRLSPQHGKPISLKEVYAQIESGVRLFKTHFLPDYTDYIDDPDTRAFLKELYRQARKVYVLRNGLDVMVSSYYYICKFDPEFAAVSFKDYLRKPIHHNLAFLDPTQGHVNRIEFWRDHVLQWRDSVYGDDMQVLRYEDWLADYEGTLQTLSTYLQKPVVGKIRDLRFKGEVGTFSYWWDDTLNKVRKRLGIGSELRSAINPRKGVSGDYQNHFDTEDVAYFYEIAGGLMQEVGYPDVTNPLPASPNT